MNDKPMQGVVSFVFNTREHGHPLADSGQEIVKIEHGALVKRETWSMNRGGWSPMGYTTFGSVVLSPTATIHDETAD